MPLYEYNCTCGAHTTARRLFSERESPEPCPECGGSMAVQFTPNGNVWLPSYHRAGIGVSFKDVHGDVTEKDLARIEGLELRQHAQSQPDRKHSYSPPVSQSTLA